MHVETRAVPDAVKVMVDDRDRGYCRMCGKNLGQARVLHHIFYGGDATGMGGRRNHHPENLISLCDAFDNRCHQLVHANKRIWQPILAGIAKYPDSTAGMTALQIRRWASG